MEKKELYKTANAKTSFIAESLLGSTARDGTEYNKIVFVLILRDGDNKAQQTVKYFLDVPTIKVLTTDLFARNLQGEFSGFKQHGGTQRGMNIKPLDEGDYRLFIMNSNGSDDKQSLYFDLTAWQVRELAITILDHVRNYELAKSIKLSLRDIQLS